MAWNSYRAGKPEEAIKWAESMIWTVPLDSDPVHVMAGHYWSARWKLYPDVDNPTQLSLDSDSVEQGINDLAALCREHTTQFYSLLAAARLYELAPARLESITRPVYPGDPSVWTITGPLAESLPLSRALQLARLGLITEALDELSALDSEALGPTGMSIQSEILAKKNWVVAHDQLHKYLLNHPPSTVLANQEHILRTAYPQTYWDLTQQAADGYGFDPRIFHALVREESSFNKDIVSWAGARGLSQLMPATARQVGGWLGMSVSKETSFDPLSNLQIGTRYMEYLQERFEGNMFLAVAGYNAGEGNVEKWLRERGNKPTDEYIEDIPYRETRGYVKRVLGTYQVYRTVYDPGPPFPDWSAYNHQAKL
jgi:soluble lytic murein transglycosylase